MTPERAVEILERWTGLLREIAGVCLNSEMSEREIVEQLALRQQSISRIQQLDAQLTEVRRLRDSEWKDIDINVINRLIADGVEISNAILRSDSQLVEIATKKRIEIIGSLRNAGLSKGYFAVLAGHRVRPPAIVDDNA